jgi:hypothetical protein
MNYVFPPQLFNGSLKKAANDADYVRGKILQTLSIIRGELVADPFYGMPLRVFQSISDIGADAARIENILTEEIPEAQFRVIGQISDSGIGLLDIFWEYQGNEFNEQFEVS